MSSTKVSLPGYPALLKKKGAATGGDFHVCYYQLFTHYRLIYPGDEDKEALARFWGRLAWRLMRDFVPAFQRPRKSGAAQIHPRQSGPATILTSAALEDSWLLVEAVTNVAKTSRTSLRKACQKIVNDGATLPMEFQGNTTGDSLFQAYKRAKAALRDAKLPPDFFAS